MTFFAGLRVLIIPRMKFSEDESKQDEERNDLKSKLMPLANVSWSCILDFNYSKNNNILPVKDENVFRRKVMTELPDNLKNERHFMDKFNSDGKELLYTSEVKDVGHFRDHFGNSDMLCVVVGPRCINDPNVGVDLADIRLFKERLGVFGNKFEMLPLFENSAASSAFSESKFSYDIVEGEQNPEKLCDFRMLNQLLSSLLPKHESIGLPQRMSTQPMRIQRSELQEFSCVEIVHLECDTRPQLVREQTLREEGIDIQMFDEDTEDLEESTSELGPDSANDTLTVDRKNKIKRVLDLEMKQFLKGKGPASWFLFKHKKIVERDVFDTIKKELLNETIINIVVHAGMHTGSTTLLRSVLYELRNSFVCLYASGSSTIFDAEKEQLKNLITNLGRRTDLQILLAIDLDQSSDSTYWMQFVETNRMKCIVVSRHSIQDYKDLERSKKRLLDSWTSFRQKSTKVVTLNLQWSKEELRMFKERHPESQNRELKIGCKDLSRFLDGHFLNLNKLYEEDKSLWREICTSSDQDLHKSGFWATDIWLIRRQDNDNDVGYVDVLQSFKDTSLHPILFGILCIDEGYKEMSKQYIAKLLTYFNSSELQIVKLLVFFSYFCPGEKVC